MKRTEQAIEIVLIWLMSFPLILAAGVIGAATGISETTEIATHATKEVWRGL